MQPSNPSEIAYVAAIENIFSARWTERVRARTWEEIIIIKTRITSIDNSNIKLNYKLIGILLHLNWFSRIKIHIFLWRLLHFCVRPFARSHSFDRLLLCMYFSFSFTRKFIVVVSRVPQSRLKTYPTRPREESLKWKQRAKNESRRNLWIRFFCFIFISFTSLGFLF